MPMRPVTFFIGSFSSSPLRWYTKKYHHDHDQHKISWPYGLMASSRRGACRREIRRVHGRIGCFGIFNPLPHDRLIVVFSQKLWTLLGFFGAALLEGNEVHTPLDGANLVVTFHDA